MQDYKTHVLEQGRVVADYNRLMDSDSFMAKALGRHRMAQTPQAFARKAWSIVNEQLEQVRGIKCNFGADSFLEELAVRQG